jgi:hypothetical protein
MSVLPNTTTKGTDRRWPLYVLVAVFLAALALGVEAFLRAETFSVGEEISSPAVRDIVVSAEDSLYPPPDEGRFEGETETVFVYLSVEELPTGEDMEARVERVASGSMFYLLFSPGPGIEVLDEQEDQLSSGSNGATGILKFALETRSGEPMPPGNYTVEIHGSGTGDGPGAVAARKSFVVEG